MGTRGNIGIQRVNYIQKSKRRKIYDKEVKSLPSSYRTFVDHTSMKTHEFAEFQKGQFKRAKFERRKQRIYLLISISMTLVFFYFLPEILYWILG